MAEIAFIKASSCSSCCGFSDDLSVRVSSRIVMSLHPDMIFLMRPPLVGAHEPFSTKATVLFWIL